MRFLLFEGIEDVKKYYPNIEDSTFNTLIALDPTYKEGKDKLGNYGKWILGLYVKNKLKDEDFYKVTELLDVFDKNKRNFQNKDINQFKSLPELYDAISNMEEVELTDRQKLRQTQNKIRQSMKDAEVVLDTPKFTVYVPKTYEASCKLGQGTSWCTATNTSDHYYNYYSKQGPLYIIVSKTNGAKWQFHFPTGSFMDQNDDVVKASSICAIDFDMLEFFADIARQYVNGEITGGVPREIDLNEIDVEEMVDYWYSNKWNTRDWVDSDSVTAVLKGPGSTEYDEMYTEVYDWGYEQLSYYFNRDTMRYVVPNMPSSDRFEELVEMIVTRHPELNGKVKNLLALEYDIDEIADIVPDFPYDAFMACYSRALEQVLGDSFVDVYTNFISKGLASALSQVNGVIWDSHDYDFTKPIPLDVADAPEPVGDDNEKFREYIRTIDLAQSEGEEVPTDIDGVNNATTAHVIEDWGDELNLAGPRYGFEPDIDANALVDVLIEELINDEESL